VNKRCLFIVQALPRVGAIANEALDLLLVAAAFELEPTVLFRGDGVYQLVAAAHPDTLGIRDVARAYSALPTYEVERIFVDRTALEAAGVDRAELSLPAVPVDGDEIRHLIASHDLVFCA
jgi:tRNA 2-thiouridine synthesizing protein C